MPVPFFKSTCCVTGDWFFRWSLSFFVPPLSVPSYVDPFCLSFFFSWNCFPLALTCHFVGWLLGEKLSPYFRFSVPCFIRGLRWGARSDSRDSKIALSTSLFLWELWIISRTARRSSSASCRYCCPNKCATSHLAFFSWLLFLLLLLYPTYRCKKIWFIIFQHVSFFFFASREIILIPSLLFFRIPLSMRSSFRPSWSSRFVGKANVCNSFGMYGVIRGCWAIWCSNHDGTHFPLQLVRS